MMRRGAAMVEILVVVVILALLVAAYLGINKRSGDKQASTPKAATDKARSVDCAANLQQLRALIELENTDSGKYPAALNPGSGMSCCPVSGKPYLYDPPTGRVQCQTPGHESL